MSSRPRFTRRNFINIAGAAGIGALGFPAIVRSQSQGRKLNLAAKAAGVATQMGTQIHAGTNYRHVVELVQSGAIGPHPKIAPATMTATFQFPARGSRPPVKLVWYQGQMKPPAWMEKQIPQWPSGHLFIGDKGMLRFDYQKHLLLPENKFAGFVPPSKSIPDSLGHHHE